MDKNQTPDILSLDLAGLTGLLSEKYSLPAYRARQIFKWLHRGAVSFGEMTDLPADLREKLGAELPITSFTVTKKLASEKDGTVKYLLSGSGISIETVLLRYNHGNTLCLSTQAGCRMGCSFCASRPEGFTRNLAPSEMLAQIFAAQADSGERISNIVLMGVGEPLDNYDNTVKFLRLVNSADGLNIGWRHISLSTCGLADKIDELAKLKLGLTLSVSLHAPDDELRARLMPINRKFGIKRLLAACRNYAQTTGRRISFEYILLDGLNDTPEHAAALAPLLAGMPCHVNLIAANPVEGRGHRPSGREAAAAFQKALEAGRVNATVRNRMGDDINAACGQLRAAAERRQLIIES